MTEPAAKKPALAPHHYPARRSSQGKRQVPREAAEKPIQPRRLPAAIDGRDGENFLHALEIYEKAKGLKVTKGLDNNV